MPDQISSPQSLSAIFNGPVLSYFSTSKYIAVFYDRKGNPVQVVNRDSHIYRILARRLSSHPIFINFEVPETGDLNGLFAAGPPGLSTSAHFNSRNIFEEISDVARFFVQYPLSRLQLYRLSESLFLGLVSINEMAARAASFEDFRVILTDFNDRIAGYSDFLPALLNLKNPRELLGKPIQEILDIAEPPSDGGSADPGTPDYAVLAGWKSGEPSAPLFARYSLSTDTVLREDGEGLRWENRSPFEYDYLLLQKVVPLDDRHLRVEMDFEYAGPHTPGIILRGNEPPAESGQEEYLADSSGYNFCSHSGREFSFMLKKGGTPVLAIPGEAVPKQSRIKLVLIKHYETFFFYFDGRLAARYKETSPFKGPSNDRLVLFLRPGSACTLYSLEVRSAPFPVDYGHRARPAPQALIRGCRAPLTFSVNRSSRVWDNIPINLYLLEDITGLSDSIRTLREEKAALESLMHREESVTGQSPAIREIRRMVERVADSGLTALLEGETGTGKEILARAIHRAGSRRDKPFIKIDCAMIPEGVMESELFGHERGAFTGAVRAHAGRLEQAQGGTVFLDEVANLPPSVQAKLLNVIQDRRIQRVGGTRVIPLDIRIVAASNIPLARLVAQGRFREDLFYRLNQLTIALPPLRDRIEDIPLLAGLFLKEAAALYKKEVRGFSPEAMEKLCRAPWPGNVRELRSTILKAVLFCDSGELSPAHFEFEKSGAAGGDGRPAVPKAKRERKVIRVDSRTFSAMVRKEKGNINRIARELQISRPSVYKLIGKYRVPLDRTRKGRDQG